jgi:hypothetical protein
VQRLHRVLRIGRIELVVGRAPRLNGRRRWFRCRQLAKRDAHHGVRKTIARQRHALGPLPGRNAIDNTALEYHLIGDAVTLKQRLKRDMTLAPE